MKKTVLLTFFFVLAICLCKVSVWAEDLPVSGGQSGETVNSDKEPIRGANNEDEDIEDIDVELEAVFIKDPIQTYNRGVFKFNDKLYFYGLKPLSKGYSTVVPEKARIGVRNFFTNIRMPIRFFNCLFQGKFKGAGTEMLRFVINTTVGGAGFSDPAKKHFHLEIQDEDFGQTLGKYGVGSDYFIEWPFLGPSNLRDTFGFIGDVALDPITLLSLVASPFIGPGARGYDTLNEVSIDKGKAYETITVPAIDPYIALQDAYTQNRVKKIKE